MGQRQSSPSQPGLSPRAAAEKFVDDSISSGNVVVFSRTDCGFCDAAKRILATETARVRATGCAAAAPPVVVDLDGALPPARARAVVDVLRERTGAATVPRVFVAGRFIGGATETQQAAREGALGLAVRAGAGCAPRH